ncbi:DUF930 domain-containing protein [Ancylobacter pratisalsi]|nr:DUF930 domain-containing protein [Ancylobacter pratisalsi]
MSDEDGAARVTALLPAREARVDLLASFALHGALLALLILAARPVLTPPDVPGIQTEVISERDFEALRGGVASPPAPTASEPALQEPALQEPALHPPVPASPPAVPPGSPSAAVRHGRAATPQPEMIRATRMLSEQALDSPRSRGLRRSLATLAGDERMAQLCDLEAMEQVQAWNASFQPDRLVDYALSDTRMEGDTLVAHGGAFRSRRQWYEISFRCELDPSQRKVIGFAFHVGEAIPRDEWAIDNLAASR